jgi:GNAT superfamily N-acetyltransferase
VGGLPVVFTVVAVGKTNAAELVSYSLEHGPEHDDSFLAGRDFSLSVDHPAYLLLSDGAVVGAVCLMRTQRYIAVRRGRFSILHSILNTKEAYSKLLEVIRQHFSGLDSVYLFVPEKKHDTATYLDGYSVHPLAPSDGDNISEFARCINENFSGLAGHTDSSPDAIRARFDNEGYVPGGIASLKWNTEAVGTLCVMREQENRNAGELLAFSINECHRGRGLGRALLRTAKGFALRNGLNPLILSVNAENEGALRLYESEGFVRTKTMACCALDCA